MLIIDAYLQGTLSIMIPLFLKEKVTNTINQSFVQNLFVHFLLQSQYETMQLQNYIKKLRHTIFHFQLKHF